MAIAEPEQPARGWWAWLVFTGGGLVAAALYAANIAPAAAFAIVGVGAILALFLGPRWHAAEPRRPWQLLAYACVCFTIGALVRPFVAEGSGPLSLLADLFTVPGYLLMMWGLTTFLSVRRGIERHSLIDGSIVCVGAAVGSALLFAVPAASIGGRPVAVSALAGMYPLFDAVLVLLVADLAFTTAKSQPSFVLLVLSVVFTLIGDIAYAIIGVAGELYSSRFLDLPFVFGFVMIGAAAVHPSAPDLSRAVPLPVQAWSWPRLMLIVPAIAVPFVLTATIAGHSPLYRILLGLGGALIVALLLLRAVSAVQSYAAAQRRYQHQATHDPLTGLPNRRMLTTAIDEMRAGGFGPDTSVWMFFLDLDGFKFVNDSWGHSAGDQLIIEVGRRMRAALPSAAVVARVGGDEFVVVAVGNHVEAMQVANDIMSCLHAPFHVGSAEVVIGGSMGIASSPAKTAATVTAEALMRDADTALYRTKSERRGRWTVFDESMHEAVLKRIELEGALRAALADEKLHIAYQPIIDLPTGRLAGAEALVRWNHPERGPIPPDVFIPIAEDSSLIATLGSWVLRRSIQQLATWRTYGTVSADFSMSINISPRQLTDPNLPDLVADALIRWRVPANRVILEITESVMIEGSVTTDQVLRELRDLGVWLSVDDFGTGFSALGYLRRYPVTGVKIDRSFVAGLGTSAEDGEIVRAVTAMGHALGLSVVAEGVETALHRDVLATLGVTLGQGWLWGRPVEPDEFAVRWGPAGVEGQPDEWLPGHPGPDQAARPGSNSYSQ
jgi:diguanylate cyclase